LALGTAAPGLEHLQYAAARDAACQLAVLCHKPAGRCVARATEGYDQREQGKRVAAQVCCDLGQRFDRIGNAQNGLESCTEATR
jgi:hypothetical protein